MTKRGIVLAGIVVLDIVHIIDHWPAEETLAFIDRTEMAAGGPPHNAAAGLLQLGADFPVTLLASSGSDAYGEIMLASARGYREMPLEDFYLAYRKTALRADEVVGWITVPKPLPAPRKRSNAAAASGEFCRVYKISKRLEDDISAVCLALQLRLDKGQVVDASIGAGGVAATPVRARATEAALRGQPWNADTVHAAMATLRAEFAPISDMRASSAYRREVLGNLLWRYWLDSQGNTATDLQSLTLEGPQP